MGEIRIVGPGKIRGYTVIRNARKELSVKVKYADIYII